MRALLKTGFALLLLAFVLIGAAYSMLRAQDSNGPSSPGSRLVASDKRPVGSGVTAIDLSGPINLVLRQGATPALEVRGEQRLLANIDTEVDGDTLHIGPRGILLRHRQPIEVSLTLPELASINVNGSGDHTVSGFAGERIEIMLSGSGSMRFNGRYRDIEAVVQGSGNLEVNGGNSERVKAESIGASTLTLVGASQELRAEFQGSGELDARHLRADDVRLEHTGSGSSAIYARERASVELQGSGAVTVYGNPDQRNVTRSGSGSVSYRD